MAIQFTAHNIRLDDGTLTKPEQKRTMDEDPWFLATRRLLDTVFPGDKTGLRIADLGCLEGGYTVEFARMGFDALGVEIRESNIAACKYVQSKTNLPNLSFVQDNVLNIARHGKFDAIFCCGLLYHLDKPKAFLETMASCTKKLAILQTHFATTSDEQARKFGLSPLTENEGLRGRWFSEFPNEATFQNRENLKWASWDNRKSFWMQREYLLQTVRDVGFDTVFEQFDSLGPDIVDGLTRGYYHTDTRGTFIGVRSRAI